MSVFRSIVSPLQELFTPLFNIRLLPYANPVSQPELRNSVIFLFCMLALGLLTGTPFLFGVSGFFLTLIFLFHGKELDPKEYGDRQLRATLYALEKYPELLPYYREILEKGRGVTRLEAAYFQLYDLKKEFDTKAGPKPWELPEVSEEEISSRFEALAPGSRKKDKNATPQEKGPGTKAETGTGKPRTDKELLDLYTSGGVSFDSFTPEEQKTILDMVIKDKLQARAQFDFRENRFIRAPSHPDSVTLLTPFQEPDTSEINGSVISKVEEDLRKEARDKELARMFSTGQISFEELIRIKGYLAGNSNPGKTVVESCSKTS